MIKKNKFMHSEFERYILESIRRFAEINNQEFYIGFEADDRYKFLDGYAPNGLFNINGSIAVDVRSGIASNTVIKSIARIHATIPEIENILIITDSAIDINILDDIKQDISKVHNILIWDREKIENYLVDVNSLRSGIFNSKDLNNEDLKNYSKSKYSDKTEDYLYYLRKSYERDELVLFLGSGVSKGATGEGEKGLPNWNELTKRLISKIIEDKYAEKYNYDKIIYSINEVTNEFSPIALGRFIKNVFDKDLRFAEGLREALYLGYERKINHAASLYSIARLCNPPRGKTGIFAVVTYNYDDLLEYYLDEFKISYLSIIQPSEIPSINEIPIYHVHGFLPQNDNINSENERSIIFGEFEYHNQYIDPYSWQNLLQLNLLREKTVVFIGLSMNDPNLRRLLDIAYKYSKTPKHYALLKDRWVLKDEELSNMLRNIEENTFKELGVNVIWYRDFSEINQIIDKIKA